jgi:hypothetical protein
MPLAAPVTSLSVRRVQRLSVWAGGPCEPDDGTRMRIPQRRRGASPRRSQLRRSDILRASPRPPAMPSVGPIQSRRVPPGARARSMALRRDWAGARADRTPGSRDRHSEQRICTRRVGTARPSTGRALAGPGRRAVRIDRARRCRLRNAAEDLGGTTIAATIGSAGERHQQPGRKDRRHQPRARNRCPRGIRGNRGRRCSARVRAGIAEAPPAPAGESRPAILGGHARHLPLRSTPTRARRTAIRRRHAAIDRDVAPHRRRTVRVARARKPHTFARPAVGVGVAVEPGLRTIRRHGAGPCVRRSRREGRQQERDAPEHDRHRRATMRDNCLRVVHEVGLTVPLS